MVSKSKRNEYKKCSKRTFRIISITDVITNSSTSVFVVHKESDINSIKELVNAILAIDGNYTFDDLFEINLEFDYDAIDYYLDSLGEEFKEFETDNDWETLINSYDSDKKQLLADRLWECINDWDACYKSPYEYIQVAPKKEIAKNAADLISRMDGIFDIDYYSSY